MGVVIEMTHAARTKGVIGSTWYHKNFWPHA
jgi:hypothetical protein